MPEAETYTVDVIELRERPATATNPPEYKGEKIADFTITAATKDLARVKARQHVAKIMGRNIRSLHHRSDRDHALSVTVHPREISQ